jgi:hypothetical protein
VERPAGRQESHFPVIGGHGHGVMERWKRPQRLSRSPRLQAQSAFVQKILRHSRTHISCPYCWLNLTDTGTYVETKLNLTQPSGHRTHARRKGQHAWLASSRRSSAQSSFVCRGAKGITTSIKLGGEPLR